MPENADERPSRVTRSFAMVATGIAVSFPALASTACDADTTASGPFPPSAPDAAPVSAAAYVDVTAPHPPLAEIAEHSGLTRFALAFVLAAGGDCAPSWGGVRPVDDPDLLSQVAALRDAGGAVTVASGGASGDYLENACPDAPALAAAYGRALDATGADALDVDIEQDVDLDTVIAALDLLHRERGTAVTLTLQVDGAAEGLTTQARAALDAAARRGLDTSVNAMVMNLPDTGHGARAMTAAADTVARQWHAIRPELTEDAIRRRLGLTFMIGTNDTGTTTTVADAAAVTRYASTGAAGSVAFWSANRDNGRCPTGALRNTCSGISQQPYEFARAVVAAR